MDNLQQSEETIIQPKKKKKGSKLFITLLCLAAVVAAGLIIHNISMEKWITEQYASLGIEQEEAASGLMQKTMREYYYKYKNMDTSDPAQVEKYINEVDYNMTGIVASIPNIWIDLGGSINRIAINTIDNNYILEITADRSFVSYKLNEQQMSEINMLMSTKSPMLLMYINTIMNFQSPLEVQNFTYIKDKFKMEFIITAKYLTERGIDVDISTAGQYFKFLCMNGDEITITYNDGEMSTYFTIKPDRLEYNSETGSIFFAYMGMGDAFFDDIAAQFIANQGKIIDLSLFLDAGFYSSNN